jgi:hypothetical protein
MNVLTLKSELAGIIHGTTLNKITNLNGVINRAVRQLLIDIDPVETTREIALGPIYDSVYDYSCPSDLKGNGMIDIKPQVQRSLRDRYPQTYSQEFDIYKEYTRQPNHQVNIHNAIKTLRITSPLINTGILLTQADTLTGSETYTGTATSFTIDNVNYAGGSGAVTFNLPASASSYVDIVSTQQKDLTTHNNLGSIFMYVYLPVAANFTSIQLRWGSDASNYWYSPLITTTQEGTVFQNGWNFISTPWTSATQVGSPDITKVDTYKIIFNYNSTVQTGVKINSFYSRLGQQMIGRYYSKYLFRNASTGAWQETITSIDDSELINLDTESYNLLLYLVAIYSVQQAFNGTAKSDTDFFEKKYEDALSRYRGLYKSERNKPKTQYYRKPAPSWRRYFGRGNYS